MPATRCWGPRGKRDLVLEGCLRLGAQGTAHLQPKTVSRGQGCRPVVSPQPVGVGPGEGPHAQGAP